jgi:integrase
LRRGNFHRSTQWTATVTRAGLPCGFHFHDLRHTGNHLAATTGASTRELMHRMGHGSMRAALIYQHATSERDRLIADRLSNLVESSTVAREDPADEASCTPIARERPKRCHHDPVTPL